MPLQPHSQPRHLRAVRRTIAEPQPPRRSWRRLLLGALAGVIVAGTGTVWYLLRPAPADTVVLAAGSVELALDVDAYVIRKERVYTAPASGAVQRLAADGQRVRVGSPVVRILPEGSLPTPAAAAQPQGGQSGTRRQIDLLSEEIYRAALALNQAKWAGDTAEADRIQGDLDQLSARQLALAASLGRTTEVIAVTPAPAPPPAAGGQEVTVDVAGVLIFETDGLEAQLSPAQADEWTAAALKSLAVVPRRTGDSTRAGEPLFKVVDNLSLSLLAVVPEAALPPISAETRLQLRITGREGETVTARITRRAGDAGEVLLQLSAPVFPEELTQRRRVRTTLVFASYEGKVVPRTAVDVRDGRQGVWVVERGARRFHPVKVLGGNSHEVALETDLAPGARILRQAPAVMR
ncbi:MAG TPA: HlyD family efflux transporter periplasmic adaptor subunit [Symbiobacteriaceae bacterium]|nr:HlyD family efflux transporter periplasmic adaptor subunit [Symbiobacteriaceae bacterium]